MKQIVIGFLIAQILSLRLFSHESGHSASGKKNNSLKPAQSKTSQRKPSNKYLLDTIVMRINGQNVLLSEMRRPSIENNGQPESPEQIIIKTALEQKAEERKLAPTVADVERNIQSFKIQNNLDLNDEELEKLLLRESNITLEGYRAEIKRMLAIQNLSHAEIANAAVVTDQEVRAYYEAHPVYSKEKYHLKKARVDDVTVKRIKQEGIAFIQEWADLGWFQPHELSKDYEFILSLQPGNFKIISKDQSHTIILLADKKMPKLKSLEKRYAEIERLLVEQHKAPLWESFVNNVMSKTSIRYLSPLRFDASKKKQTKRK